MKDMLDAKSGFALRWSIIRDPSKVMAARAFALAEMVLLPLSFVTFGYVALEAVLGWFGVSLSAAMPTWLTRWALPVLTAAAIGYVTNWLAILMLFKPYEKHKWLVVWPQGLLPRNKANIAREVGNKVGTELLPPKALIDEFEADVRDYLSRSDVVAGLRNMMQKMLKSHEPAVVGLLVPQVESAVGGILERFVTPKQLQAFWDETLAPRLNDPETREFLARKIIEVIDAHAPELVQGIRTKLRAHLNSMSLMPEFLVEVVMEFFADETAIRELLSDWLGQPETQATFRDKLLLVGEKTDEWMKSTQGQAKLERFTGEMKRKCNAYATQYVREALPKILSQAFSSETLWKWVEQTALPSAKDRLLAYLSERKDALVGKLRLAERVESAINAQDVAQFHKMLNDLAAQHLSAIQVLGYVLGAIIGAIQLC